jgi:endonuclease-8
MPEGDTIWRAARALEAALAGRTVTRVASRDLRLAAVAEQLAIVGRTVAGVESRGKHLLVLFEGGAALHTHLGMHGRWSVGAPPPPGGASVSVVLEAGGVAAVCRGAAVAELLSARGLARQPALARLGPDVLAGGFDAASVRARLRACGGRTIGEALVDQAVLAGIGNVYKSEVLFICRVSPFDPVSALGDDVLDRLLGAARRLMQRNLGPGARRTTSALAPVALHVYRRGGRPCRACGTPVVRVVQGLHARSTYFCPRCQPRAAALPVR